MLYYYCFRKDGIMVKDGGWLVNLLDLFKIYRYGVGFFFYYKILFSKI